MAIRVDISQPAQAIFGAPCNFVVSVTNLDATDPVNILSMDVSVTNQQGAPSTSHNIGDIAAPPGVSTPGAVGTSQLNIQVAPSGVARLSVPISFFGQVVAGPLSAASPNFVVVATATGMDLGDSSIFATSSPGLVVPMNRPGFGQQPGSPPNRSPIFPGGLDFTTPGNSPLAL